MGSHPSFFSEDGMKQAGLPKEVVDQLMGMQVGGFTEPKLINNRWYILKLQEKRLQTENLTLESPNVRQQINAILTDQRKTILNAALLEVALSEAKIVNHFALSMLNNPANLGLRPASSAAKPGTTTTAATPAPCRLLATVKSVRLSQSPHRTDEMVKIAMAAAKSGRAPNRSATQPLAGMRIATAST